VTVTAVSSRDDEAMRADAVPPSGTVTFLFTDIEGSTRLWQEHAVEMAEALERHDSIVRRAIASHGGFVFTTAGDSFAAAFSRAGDAVAAAIDAQRLLDAEPWPAATPLRVRMGLCSGEAQERHGDYFGSVVNRAARIMGLGSGGQILMSALTRDLAGAEGRPEGLCEIRGLAERVEVFSVLADGLHDDFPPLRAARKLGNLPAESGTLVGRQTLLGELTEQIRAERLVTLVGPGGIGKTSLALAVAHRIDAGFPGGVWFVDLAPVRVPEAVVTTLGSVVGARGGGGDSLLSATLGVLSSEPALVVMDNCEHLVDAAAELVSRLIGETKATVMATSRSPLHLHDEIVRHVPPLRTAGPRSDAVDLFVKRARQVRDDLELDEATIEAVREIVELVDGMPLAVELAAARCRSMSAADVLTRLRRDADRVLRDVRRDGQERQRTLEATVSWSVDLLAADAREIFARLSVFAGSFDLDAAEAICSDGSVDEPDVVDLLDELVDQSLLTPSASAASCTRYRMLEPIRQFAENRLADAVPWRHRHGRHYASLADEGYEAMWTSAEPYWIERFEADFANYELAYRYWAGRTELTPALTIAIALNQYGELAAHRPAGAEILFDAVRLDGVDRHELGPIALAHAATALGRRREDGAAPLAHRAVELASTPRARFEAAFWSGATGLFTGDSDLVYAYGEMCRSAAAELPDQRATDLATVSEATGLVQSGGLKAAEQIFAANPVLSESSLLRSIQILPRISHAELTDQPDRALEIAVDAARRAHEAGNLWAAGSAIIFGARSAVSVLPPRELLALLGNHIRTWRQANDLARLRWSLLYCAQALHRLGDSETSAQLLGGCRLMNERDEPLESELRADLRAALGLAELNKLIERGRQQPARALADTALDRIDAHTSGNGTLVRGELAVPSDNP
jgi:predicted ATPase/class 3 adenylate cyclase